CTQLERTFVAIDTMGGRNFMMGNYEYTLWYRMWDTIDLQDEKSWDYVLRQDYPEASQVSQGQLDKLALKGSLGFVLQNPGLSAKRAVVKFFNLWGLERELVAGVAQGNFGDNSLAFLVGFAAVIFASYGLTLLLGLFGLFLTPSQDRRA